MKHILVQIATFCVLQANGQNYYITFTTAISAVTQTTALSGGNVNDEGSALIASGVWRSTSENPTIADDHTSDGTNTGTHFTP